MSTLNRKITIYSGTTAATATGGNTITWDGGTVVWADIQTQDSTKIDEQGKAISMTIYTITIRSQCLKYSAPIENYKITINAYNGYNRSLRILSVSNPDLKQIHTVIKCIETNTI